MFFTKLFKIKQQEVEIKEIIPTAFCACMCVFFRIIIVYLNCTICAVNLIFHIHDLFTT